MKIHEIEQRTPEWLRLRLGKITGTRAKEVFKASNLSLIDELISEILTGEIENHFVSDAMQYGIDTEPLAVAEYEKRNDIKIETPGFCTHDLYEWAGLSPDGFFNNFSGAIEIKCPTPKKHVEYIRMNQLPNDYKFQVYMYFFICETLEFLDFVSYCPKFSIKPMFIFRVNRADILAELVNFENELLKFNSKFQKYYDQIIFA